LGAGKSARLLQDVFLEAKSMTSDVFENPPTAQPDTMRSFLGPVKQTY